MFLQVKGKVDLVKIVDFQELLDPNSSIVHGKDQEGEEEQDMDIYEKQDLVFPSGEELPRCWWDSNYRSLRSR
ncbi:acetyltransferase [Cylindrospermopsis raciborskii]|uniref:Acetyltransferase n=1 Tax=Cylindrospermopsis raciborskii C07 TaxID=2014886 RepID=A0ABX4WKH0_9CYAN|nr:acetyltransferase [Cylindrospermopsis raciborskii]PNJ92416.1 acetyltransferase [Cylindrospermopsis raciborskii C07]PNJ94118.1 acetyltransferase [Cylindrospermopsis raciborskii C04]PNJ96765.1 acetyltransferase [Cylindrospermopsis raciborskii C03]